MHNISLMFVPNNSVSVGAPLPTKPVFAGTCFLFVPWKFSLPYFKWNFEIPNFSFKSGLEFSENVSLNTKQSSHIDTVAPSGTFEQFASLYIFSSVLIPWFSVSWLVKQRSEFVFFLNMEPLILAYLLKFKVMYTKFHEQHEDFRNTNICYFGCLNS